MVEKKTSIKSLEKKQVKFNVPEWIVQEYDKMASEIGSTRTAVMQIALKSYIDSVKAMQSMDGMKEFLNAKLEETFKLALEDKNKQ